MNKQIKVILYSTGNYIQYSMTNHNGKEYEKEYICITESLYCTEEIKHDIANQLLLLSHFSRVQLCATPQTAAHQASPSLGFSRQEHWSGLPFPSVALILYKSEKTKGCVCMSVETSELLMYL